MWFSGNSSVEILAPSCHDIGPYSRIGVSAVGSAERVGIDTIQICVVDQIVELAGVVDEGGNDNAQLDRSSSQLIDVLILAWSIIILVLNLQ